MGYYVGVNFSFSNNSIEKTKLAAIKTLKNKNIKDSYTGQMLQLIIDNPPKCLFEGNKGDMFIWGGVFNYYTAEDEIPYLKKFLKNCWRYCDDLEDILFDFDTALLIVNPEQSDTSYIYEFGYDKESKNVVVKEKISDLSWHQY